MKAKYIILPVLLLLAPGFMAGAQSSWLELPSKGNKDMDYSTQYMFKDGKKVRSHTYCFDPALRISRWVAYPLNAGLIGSGSRGEGWHPYEGISEYKQAALYKGFAYGSGYDRGHQIPSADRLDLEINYETFVFANATPQRHEFNEGIWTDLERLVRTWAKRSDTLYVVTGILPGKETIKDNAGRPVNIPRAYYKTVIRKNTDRRGEVHWSSCSILIPHNTKPPQNMNWPQTLEYLKGFSCTIDELEEVTKEDFFPNLHRFVGGPRAEILEFLDPKEEDWWWK